MLRASRYFLPLFLLFSIGCQKEEAPLQPALPYALDAPETSAVLFAPEIISTALPEFASVFTPDGHTIYFNRTPPDRSSLIIYTSTYQDGSWSMPVPVSFSDGTYRDIDPFVTADGARLYFSSNRPTEGTDPREDFDIWYVEKTASGWGKPRNLGAPVNTDQDEIYATLTENGDLYYSTFAEDRTVTIFKAAFAQGTFQQPEPLSFDPSLRLTNPCISPDGKTLLFSGRPVDSEAPPDLYASYADEAGVWSVVERLNERVNTPYTEFAPHITPDGTMLFFTSERPGIVPEGAVEGRPPGDIYRIPLSLTRTP